MPARGDGNKAAKAIKGVLDAARADLLSLLVGDPAVEASTEYDWFLAQQRSAAIDAVLDEMNREMVVMSNGAMQAAATKAVEDLSGRIASMGVGVPIVGIDPNVLRFVQDTTALQVVGVTDIVRSKIKGAVQRAIAGASKMSDLRREIRDAFKGGATEARVERILRTEVVRAYSQTQAAADEKLADTAVGEDLIKRWTTVGDSRTRVEHAMIDGQERELDGLFNIGKGATAATPPSGPGWRANAPSDPSLPPELSIQCRCTIVYVRRSEARQTYIEKNIEKVRARRRAG